MILYRSEICVEVLIESGIAKTLKYLQDYCKLYESDVPELKSLINNCDQILQKWRNFVNNKIFGEKQSYDDEFHKFKYMKKLKQRAEKKEKIVKQSITTTHTIVEETRSTTQRQITVQ